MVWTGKTQWVERKFDIYHIYCVLLSPNVKMFNKPRHLTDEVRYLSPLNRNQSHTNYIAHNLLNSCSDHTTFTLHRTRFPNTQFAVFISDTPVTLKQRQGHQNYNDNVDSKQGYNHAKFERPCFNGVWGKAIVFHRGNTSIISPECVQQQKNTQAKKKSIHTDETEKSHVIYVS